MPPDQVSFGGYPVPPEGADGPPPSAGPIAPPPRLTTAQAAVGVPPVHAVAAVAVAALMAVVTFVESSLALLGGSNLWLESHRDPDEFGLGLQLGSTSLAVVMLMLGVLGALGAVLLTAGAVWYWQTAQRALFVAAIALEAALSLTWVVTILAWNEQMETSKALALGGLVHLACAGAIAALALDAVSKLARRRRTV